MLGRLESGDEGAEAGADPGAEERGLEKAVVVVPPVSVAMMSVLKSDAKQGLFKGQGASGRALETSGDNGELEREERRRRGCKKTSKGRGWLSSDHCAPRRVSFVCGSCAVSVGVQVELRRPSRSRYAPRRCGFSKKAVSGCRGCRSIRVAS